MQRLFWLDVVPPRGSWIRFTTGGLTEAVAAHVFLHHRSYESVLFGPMMLQRHILEQPTTGQAKKKIQHEHFRTNYWTFAAVAQGCAGKHTQL